MALPRQPSSKEQKITDWEKFWAFVQEHRDKISHLRRFNYGKGTSVIARFHEPWTVLESREKKDLWGSETGCSETSRIPKALARPESSALGLYR